MSSFAKIVPIESPRWFRQYGYRSDGTLLIPDDPLQPTMMVVTGHVAANRVTNGREVGGVRTLSGVIAHETCHTMERRHFGLVAMASAPTSSASASSRCPSRI